MLVSVLYQPLMVIGYPILLSGLKMGNDVLDQSGMRAISAGNGAGGDFILYDIHEG